MTTDELMATMLCGRKIGYVRWCWKPIVSHRMKVDHDVYVLTCEDGHEREITGMDILAAEQWASCNNSLEGFAGVIIDSSDRVEDDQ